MTSLVINLCDEIFRFAMRLLFFAGIRASQTRHFRHCAVSFITSWSVLFIHCDCLFMGKNYNLVRVYCRTLANGSGAVKNSSKLPRSTDRKNSLSSPAMPLTTSQGERSRVTFHDDVKLSSNHRVGLMTSAVRAWQQQGLCRTKNSQVMSTKMINV
jgi:hypothetical protein